MIAVVGERLLRAHAAQVRADAREQLLHRERLGEVVVGAGVEAAHLVALGVERGDHDDRGLLVGLAQLLGDLVAVHAGEHEVEQDRGRGGTPRRRVCASSAVGDRPHGEARALQGVLDGLPDDRVVFDDEDRGHVGVLLGDAVPRVPSSVGARHHCTRASALRTRFHKRFTYCVAKFTPVQPLARCAPVAVRCGGQKGPCTTHRELEGELQ